MVLVTLALILSILEGAPALLDAQGN